MRDPETRPPKQSCPPAATARDRWKEEPSAFSSFWSSVFGHSNNATDGRPAAAAPTADEGQQFVEEVRGILRHDPKIRGLVQALGDGEEDPLVQLVTDDDSRAEPASSEAESSGEMSNTGSSMASNETAEATARAESASTSTSTRSGLLVTCRACGNDGPEGNAKALFGVFPDSGRPEITLCTNRLHSRSDVRRILAHELTHAYDFCVRGMNLTDCSTLACSEVRAAHAGDCADTSDAFFGYPRKWCVRLNARVATQNMFPQGGQAAVDRVFDRCYADCSPMPHGDGASVPAKQSSGESGEPTVPSAKPGE